MKTHKKTLVCALCVAAAIVLALLLFPLSVSGDTVTADKSDFEFETGEWGVFLLSMVPVIELRGAVPLGATVWNVDMLPCLLLAVAGNLLPVPFLLLFGGAVLRRLAKLPRLGKPFRAILSLGEKKVSKMKKTLFWGLLAFVAIPLPGTGAWTGSLVAITLGLDIKKSFLPIALGVIIAGTVMALGSYGVVSIFSFFVGG